MLKARALRKVTDLAAGVGEVYAPGAAAVQSPPNPNRALDAFLVADPEGDGHGLRRRLLARRGQGLAQLGRGLVARRLLGRRGVVADVSWSDVSWSDVSWSDVSWSDVSWADVSWTDVSWADVSNTRLRRRGALSRLLAQAFQQPQRALVPRHAVRDARAADAAAVREVPVVRLAERLLVREPRREAEQRCAFAVST